MLASHPAALRSAGNILKISLEEFGSMTEIDTTRMTLMKV
jgi:hypothetical protein